MKRSVQRAITEIAFVVLLFYSNLLMGEYVQGGPGFQHGPEWAVRHIFTWTNFEIALGAAFLAYVLFEFLRKKL